MMLMDMIKYPKIYAFTHHCTFLPMSTHLLFFFSGWQRGLLTRFQFTSDALGAEHAGRLRRSSLLGHFGGCRGRGGDCVGTARIVCRLIFQRQRDGRADGVGVGSSLLSPGERGT